MKKLNLTGQKFNRLTVLEEATPLGGRSAWKCQCDCGVLKIIKQDHLRDGSTKSCGCLNDEQRSARAQNMYSKCIKYTPIKASAIRVWQKRYREMSFEDFLTLSQMNCDYCTTLPSNNQNTADHRSSEDARKNGNFIYNGLDRVDNTLPHSKENCVPCCKSCNYAKRDRTYAEFKAWIVRVYENIKDRN